MSLIILGKRTGNEIPILNIKKQKLEKFNNMEQHVGKFIAIIDTNKVIKNPKIVLPNQEQNVAVYGHVEYMINSVTYHCKNKKEQCSRCKKQPKTVALNYIFQVGDDRPNEQCLTYYDELEKLNVDWREATVEEIKELKSKIRNFEIRFNCFNERVFGGYDSDTTIEYDEEEASDEEETEEEKRQRYKNKILAFCRGEQVNDGSVTEEELNNLPTDDELDQPSSDEESTLSDIERGELAKAARRELLESSDEDEEEPMVQEKPVAVVKPRMKTNQDAEEAIEKLFNIMMDRSKLELVQVPVGLEMCLKANNIPECKFPSEHYPCIVSYSKVLATYNLNDLQDSIEKKLGEKCLILRRVCLEMITRLNIDDYDIGNYEVESVKDHFEEADSFLTSICARRFDDNVPISWKTYFQLLHREIVLLGRELNYEI